MQWTEESIARLRSLWAEGLSTAEIGRRMGVSKNAVVGKAHRLLLDSRPSPIRREAEGGRAHRTVPRRVTGPTLPTLTSLSAMDDAAEEKTLRAPVVEPGLDLARPARSLPPLPERRRGHACCWPIGEPGTREFRFCDADAVPGRPYCEAHVAVAYVKVRDRREDAA